MNNFTFSISGRDKLKHFNIAECAKTYRNGYQGIEITGQKEIENLKLLFDNDSTITISRAIIKVEISNA